MARAIISPVPSHSDKTGRILVYEPGEDGVVDILGLIPEVIPFDIAMPRFTPER